MSAAVRYAIGELAMRGGVNRRTVRYYVQEGLVPPPLGLGRGNHYTEEHLQRLLQVKAMREAGWSLEEIRRRLAHGRAPLAPLHQPSVPAPAPELWRRVVLASGVELHVAGDIALPPEPRLLELVEWCRRHLTRT